MLSGKSSEYKEMSNKNIRGCIWLHPRNFAMGGMARHSLRTIIT